MSGQINLVAGVDTSTQATKVLVVDPEDGRVVAVGRAPHEVTGADGARETDPETWWRALGGALEQTGRAGDVSAISVAGQQHGLVALDGDGHPLRSAILWNDTRSATEARELTAALGGGEAWAERIGLVPVPSFTATRWAWLRRHEPAVADAVRAVRLPHDFVTERLCGRGATDRGDASGTAWWSTRDEGYDAGVLDLIDLDPALLPAVLGPREPAGELTAPAARELGMSEGTLVGPGTGDNMGAALGLGACAGRARGEPRNFRNRLCGDGGAGRRPDRHRRRLRGRERPLPAADRDPERHPGDRPGGRLARPRPRGGGPAHGRGRGCPTSTASGRRTCRARPE